MRWATGLYHIIALDGSGTVWTWGQNQWGQLGDGSTTGRRTPARVPDLVGVRAVFAGGGFSLALDGGGALWAWGYNVVGQLGDGTFDNRLKPQKITGLAGPVSRVAAGFLHTLCC